MNSKNCEPDFHELNERIITLSEDIPQNFIELAKRLKVMRDEKIYRSAGHRDFTAYLYSLDNKTGKMDRSTVYDLIGIYENFGDLIIDSKDTEYMKQIGWSKLRILCRYVRFCRQIISEGCEKPILVNLTRLFLRGLNKPKRSIEKGLQELKEDPDISNIANLALSASEIKSKLKNNWGPRCPKCGENERVFSLIESSQGGEVYEVIFCCSCCGCWQYVSNLDYDL